MQHDPLLRAAARAVYDAVYPSEEWAPTGFEEAERLGTPHYRQAVEGAMHARSVFGAPKGQLMLFETTDARRSA